MLSVFAEFETNLRKERQAEGIAKAKANGLYKGRKRSIKPEAISELRAQSQRRLRRRSGSAEQASIGLLGQNRQAKAAMVRKVSCLGHGQLKPHRVTELDQFASRVSKQLFRKGIGSLCSGWFRHAVENVVWISNADSKTVSPASNAPSMTSSSLG